MQTQYHSKGWYAALDSALQQESQAVMQLATIEPGPPATPRVRSLIHRAFITAAALPALPLILSTTDVRTPKVAQLAANPAVEVTYWTPHANAQFRVRGRASVVPAPGHRDDGATRPARGVVYDALAREGFDWEARRVATFDGMSAHMRATWCRPVPGTPVEGGEDAMRRWPVRLPKVGEVGEGAEEDEETRRRVEEALGNFALLVIEPLEVDHVELGVLPERRRLFVREEGSVEFKETLLVP